MSVAWTLWPQGWSSPHLSQGLVVGKMRGRNNVDVLQEVFMEPVGIVKLGHVELESILRRS